MGTTTTTKEFRKRLFTAKCAETIAWNNAVLANGGTVSAAQFGLVDDFNRAIRNAGIRLDRAWLMSGMENATQAKYDVIGGNAHTFIGPGTFASRWSQADGFIGSGTGHCLDTNFTPRTANGNYQIGNCMTCLHINNIRSAFSTETTLGASDGVDAVMMLMYFSGGPNININGIQPFPTVADSQSILIASRNSSLTEAKAYSYKSATPATATASGISNSPLLNRSIFIGGYNNDGTTALTSADKVGAAIIGAGVNDAQADALAAAINTYMTSGGATFHY